MIGNSLSYQLLGVPANLLDLVDKARTEREYQLHFLAEYSETYSCSGSSNHWTEVEFKARYWHGRKKREVAFEQFDLRNGVDGSKLMKILMAMGLMKELGFSVETRRSVIQRKGRRIPYGKHALIKF